ncbi:MAG: wapA 3 [Ignavibacteria bacterium]|nr:wapA 3 [Ignavibacteria bacterium]
MEIGGVKKTMNNAPNGNFDSKTDIGDYSYHTTKKHALAGITNGNENSLSSNIQEISYTPFQKVASISEGNNTAEFVYGPNDERRMMVITNTQAGVTKRFYGNGYEKEILPDNKVRELHYISSPNGLIAVYVKETGAADILYYVHTDRQGSIVGLTKLNSNNQPERVARYSYDAWGRIRNATTWQYETVAAYLTIIPRGYTGHEHLEMFAIINMNGRLYDPAVGRFFSPDNFVQFPGFSQSFNRYSYCVNNPLKYTDPSGETWGWDDIIAFAIGFIIDYASYGIKTGDWGWNAVQQGIIGGVKGWLTYYCVDIAGIWNGIGLGITVQVALGGIQNGIKYWSEGKGFANGLAKYNYFPDIISGGINGGITGYNIAKKAGLNYWWGTQKGKNCSPWSIWNDGLPDVPSPDVISRVPFYGKFKANSIEGFYNSRFEKYDIIDCDQVGIVLSSDVNNTSVIGIQYLQTYPSDLNDCFPDVLDEAFSPFYSGNPMDSKLTQSLKTSASLSDAACAVDVLREGGKTIVQNTSNISMRYTTSILACYNNSDNWKILETIRWGYNIDAKRFLTLAPINRVITPECHIKLISR